MYFLKVFALILALSGVTLSVPVDEQDNSDTATQSKRANRAELLKTVLAKLKGSHGNEKRQKAETSQPKRHYGTSNDPYMYQATSYDAWNAMSDYGNYWDDSGSSNMLNDAMGGSYYADYNNYWGNSGCPGCGSTGFYDQYSGDGYGPYDSPAYYDSSYLGNPSDYDWSSMGSHDPWGMYDYLYSDCDCSYPTGGYCWDYCGFGNDYPTSTYYDYSDNYYYDGSTYNTWSDSENAYWAFADIAYGALNDMYCENFDCGDPYAWKRAVSQFRRGRRQLQKKELQKDRTDGEDKKPKHAQSPKNRRPSPDKTSSNRKLKLDKTPNSQNENNKAQKRYYSTTTPELKSKVEALFLNYLEKMVQGIQNAGYNSAYSETSPYDPYSSWKRTIEDIKKKKSGLQNLKKKIEQKKKEMGNKRRVPTNK